MIARWFRDALRVADPEAVVSSALTWDGTRLTVVDARAVPVGEGAVVVVIAIGKGAVGMARGARSVLGSRITRGVVVTKHGQIAPPMPEFRVLTAGHPLPDADSLVAGQAVLDAVAGLTSRDLVMTLLSGGGSALVEVPGEGVSLDQLRATTRDVMNAGADIYELNRIRQSLSRIKGGGLRRAVGPARCVTVLLSDVLGNDPAIIASGPTVMPGHDSAADIVTVVADNRRLVTEILRLAAQDGVRGELAWDAFAGDADAFGTSVSTTLQSSTAPLLVGGGEATVVVRGEGSGGRNTQAALVAAQHLPAGWVFASLASDGDDGHANAAGAIVDSATRDRLAAANVNIIEAIRNNDAATALKASGDLLETGPTGTNVNDVYIAMRCDERGDE